MALRRVFGFTDGELMRADCKPCSTLMKHTATIFTVGGGIGFWVLCRLHYGRSHNSSARKLEKTTLDGDVDDGEDKDMMMMMMMMSGYENDPP